MAFVVALLATVVAVPLVMRFSSALGLVDTPGSDPLKIHQRPIPRSGGVAIGIGLAASGFVVRPNPALIVGGLGALALGLVDDRTNLSARFRFLAEALIATVTSVLLVGADNWPRTALGVVVIVVAMNAANLFDGLDALLSGAGLLTAIGLASLLLDADRLWLWALAGCLLGFLVYNRPPARIFLGDGGAYLVGMILGIGLLQLSFNGPRFFGGMLAFGAIALDFVVTLMRRWRASRPLFVGDRSHIYDQLADRGWSIWRILLVVLAVHTGLIALGLWVATLFWPGGGLATAAILVIPLLIAWRLGFVGPQKRLLR